MSNVRFFRRLNEAICSFSHHRNTLSSAITLNANALENPLNRETYNNYSETCATAESNSQFKVAEEACYRALVNVDLGNLGSELKSQSLYNLGRIKRNLGKFAESERLLKESLTIEEKLSPSTDIKIGRRLVELSVSLAAQNKWSEGAIFLERVIPIADQYYGQERSYIAESMMHYGKRLKILNQNALANQFEEKASALR